MSGVNSANALVIIYEWLLVAFGNIIVLIQGGKRTAEQLQPLREACQAVIDKKEFQVVFQTVTLKQISALRYIIFCVKVGDLSKRVLAFLINSSRLMQEEVCLSLVADREGYTSDEIKAAALDVRLMISRNGRSINQILDAMGSNLHFSVHYGDFDSNRTGDQLNYDGILSNSGVGVDGKHLPDRYTFWLSKDFYSRRATLVVATREEIEQIDIKDSGLYS